MKATRKTEAVTTTGQLPPARRVRHHHSLLWWMAVLLVGGSLYWSQGRPGSRPAAAAPPATENEAFLSIVFGKVSDADPEAISSSTFRDHLEAVQKAGYTTIRLADVDRFVHEAQPLPAKPLLITFEQARRDTLEIADPVLASLGMNAVAFANVEALDQGNLELVSVHRLSQLVSSWRWEAAVSGCTAADQATGGGTAFPAAAMLRERELLARWIGHSVAAIDCQRAWANGDRSATQWSRALGEASYPLGFIVAPPGANYQDDSPLTLRRLRVWKEWRGADLVANLDAHSPRRERFRDDLREPAPRADWIRDRGDLDIENGALRLRTTPGQNGAVAFLGGTERWRDAEAEVRLGARPSGQFWIYLRRLESGSFVRLGVVGDRVLLQEAGDDGRTRQLAGQPLQSGTVTLTLRVEGQRAVALQNGTPLTPRPAAIADRSQRGSFALAAWSEGARAAVRLQHVEARPLPFRCALLSASPDAASWQAIQRQADQLTAISPLAFSWRDGKARDLQPRDPLLEVLARYHRLRFLPGVEVEGRLGNDDWESLRQHLSRWAAGSRADGLNLVVRASDLDVNTLAFVASARRLLHEQRKDLVLTSVGHSTASPLSVGGWEWFFRADPAKDSVRIARSDLVFLAPEQ